MDKLWELLSLKVIHLAIGKRARVTRKLQDRFLSFSWFLPVHQKVRGSRGSTSCCQSPSAALLCTGKSKPVFPPAAPFLTHIFFYSLSQLLSYSHKAGSLPSPIHDVGSSSICQLFTSTLPAALVSEICTTSEFGVFHSGGQNFPSWTA